MTELTFLIIGILIGGCFGATTMCCFQLNRVNAYEAELHKLKKQLKEERTKNNF
jgi:hypothetical protein